MTRVLQTVAGRMIFAQPRETAASGSNGPMSSPIAAVLVAAGQGRRFGTEKLWLDFWGRPVWRWSLDTLLSLPDMGVVVLVVPAGDEDRFGAALPEEARNAVLVVPGGAERTDSVVAGITALTAAGVAEDTPVLVHDAARPAATPELMVRVVAAVRAGTGAVPLVPVADSLKTLDAARMVSGSVERDGVMAAQTPQGATLRQLRAALEETHAWGTPCDRRGIGHARRRNPGPGGRRGAGEPQADRTGRRCHAAGRAGRLGAARWRLPPRPRACGPASASTRTAWRRAGRCGWQAWTGPAKRPGSAGHSDGDAALHAVIDALLGAARPRRRRHPLPAGRRAVGRR